MSIREIIQEAIDSKKKYSFTGKRKGYLKQIVALKDFSDVKKGDVGGWIESERNLSHEGNCWVYGNAKISGFAEVYEDARISGRARVFEEAKVFGNAWIRDDAKVFGGAEISGNATVSFNARVWDAKISGDTRISKDTDVSEDGIIGKEEEESTPREDESLHNFLSNWKLRLGLWDEKFINVPGGLEWFARITGGDVEEFINDDGWLYDVTKDFLREDVYNLSISEQKLIYDIFIGKKQLNKQTMRLFK